MATTAKQIQGDIRRLLIDSPLGAVLSGGVYRNGYRPLNSGAEDAIVTFTAGIPEQIHTGVATVCIFIPDIDPDGDGTWVEDGARTEQIELLAQQWAATLNDVQTRYLFTLRQTICTEAEPEIRQHFVVVRLGYSLLDD